MTTNNQSQKRPALSRIKTASELDHWYWLKSELVAFAKKNGIPYGLQKPELQKRIGIWLDTGKVATSAKPKAESSFDWSKEPISLVTEITDSYKNSKNVRQFMLKNAGARFRFSNEFMQWMRTHTGFTMKDAVHFWQDLDRKKRTQGYREKSLPQNQYAQFCRSLSEAKPGISAKEIRRIWNIKKSGPAPHRYKAGDENL